MIGDDMNPPEEGCPELDLVAYGCSPCSTGAEWGRVALLYFCFQPGQYC